MFNGDFIVKQSKFLLFITILYIKDCSNANNNPIFDFDFDLISDILSLTEDLMNLFRNYGDFEMSKYFLPQHKWVIRNEDVHLNYSLLIKKYGLSEEEQSEENEDAVTFTLLKVPNYEPENELLRKLYTETTGNYWVRGDVEDKLAYHLALNKYEEWIGCPLLNRQNIHLSPSNSELLNFRRDKFGEVDLFEIFGIVYHFTKIRSALYSGEFDDMAPFIIMDTQNFKNNNKVTLTVALSIIVWILRFISAVVKLVVKLNKNIYLLFPEFSCDSTFKLIFYNSLVYVIRTALYNNLPLAIIVYINCTLHLNRSKIKKPLALPDLPRKPAVNNFIHYIKVLIYTFFEKFSVSKTNEETSLVLYKPKEPSSSLQNKLSLLHRFRSHNNIYSKLLLIINYYWIQFTQCNFFVRLRYFKNVFLYKFSTSLKKAVQVLLLLENVNYVTVSS